MTTAPHSPSIDELDPLALAPGSRLGSYEVVRRLGAGGMGAVWHFRRDGRDFAAKLANKRLSEMTASEREDAEKRTRREISNLYAVNHPNVVRIHEAVWLPTVDGYLTIITDLVDGKPFDLWQQEQRPSLRVLAERFIELSSGLQRLHDQTIFHRDIKPDNVLVSSQGHVMLVDFGISRSDSSQTHTSVSALVGSPLSQSPEALRHFLEARGLQGERYYPGPGDDLYAVGVMFFEALIGTLPFRHDDELEYFQAAAYSPPPDVTTLAPAVPPGLGAVVTRLLAKTAEQRYPSAGELQDALEDLLATADDRWEQPYEQPKVIAEPPRPEQPTADGRRRTRSRPGSSQGLSSLLLDEAAPAAGKAPTPMPPVPVRTATPSVSRPQTPAPAASPRSAPAAASPREGFRPPTALRPTFQPLEAASAPAPESELEPAGLPPALAEAAQVLKEAGGTGGRPKPTALIAAAVVVAGVLIAGAITLKPTSPKATAPTTLLGEFERANSQHLERRPAPAQDQSHVLAAPPSAPAEPPLGAPSTDTKPPASGSMAAVTAAPAVSSTRMGNRHRPPSTPSQSAPLAAAQPPAPARRKLTGSMIVEATEAPGTSRAAAPRCPKGALIKARLTIPADPAGAPFAATVSEDVSVDGAVVVPKGATLACTTQGGARGRVTGRCDTLNIPGRGSVAFEGTVMGADQQLGIPVASVGGPGAGTDVGNAALGVVEHVASRLAGSDVAGDVTHGAVSAGTAAARRAQPGEVQLRPAPRGTSFVIFVQQQF